MKLRFLLLAVAGIAIICSGCCACKRAQKAAKPLVGTTWHLVQIGGNDVALPEDTFNVTFGADGRVFGIGACNRLTGTYTTSANNGLNVGPVGMTMMLCPKNSNYERELGLILEEATHYGIDKDTLILLKDGTVKALFKATTVKTE